MRRAIVFSILFSALVIVAHAQTLTTLYRFCSQPNCTDGTAPEGTLRQTSDGNFYGTTSDRGASGGGTVFKMTPEGTLTTLYSFCSQESCADGAHPSGALVQATDGNFYGTTTYGGSHGGGTVFKMTPEGILTTLYSFCSQENCADGQTPLGGLVQASDGNFYGTANSGGQSQWFAGTVFKITPEGVLTTLYSFCSQENCSDGYAPNGGLVQATDGNIYGTASSGGTYGNGTVFKIGLQGEFTTLYRFVDRDGQNPRAGLVQASNGLFYGTTYLSDNGGGTIFEITPAGKLRVLYEFCSQLNCSDGRSPVSELVQATSGSFYGMTLLGGAIEHPLGTIFKISPDGIFSRLYTFCSQPNCEDGSYPSAGLVQAADGKFYGTTPSFIGTSTFFSLDDSGTLSVSKSGNGLITSNDGGINCGLTCSHRYLNGSRVLLNAIPDQGWILTAWSGCDSVQNDVCTVIVSNDRAATASFRPKYQLSVSNSGNGLVSSGDGHIYCGATCSYSYADGTQVRLTANPNAGYTLASWNGCNSAQDNVCTVIMSSAKNVTATFTQAQVSLTSLVLKPTSVKGGNISIATLTLGQAAPPGGFGVGVSSDHPLVVQPPSLIVVPGGRTSISFAVRTSAVRTKTVVNVTATANNSHANATLTVNTNYGSAQKLANTPPAEDEQATHRVSGQQNRSASRQPLPQ